ncbi:MAG: tetratricopeptide repeat protein [Pseudonocardiaceae bacterium]
MQRWESGDSTPRPWHRPRLAAALDISLDELARLLADAPCSDETSRTESALSDGSDQQAREGDLLPFLSVGDITNRRQAVKLLSTSALGAAFADLDPFMQSAVEAMEFTRRAEASQLGPMTLEHIESVVRGIAADFAHTLPGELFSKVRWYRREVEDLITGRHTLREGKELYRHAGWLSVILAWLSNDLGDPVTAEAHCMDAWEHGWQAEDNEICAWAMDAKATIFTYSNQSSAARDAAERGLQQAPRGSAAAVRVGAQLARAYAKLGQADQFKDVLKGTQIRLEQLDHQSSGLFSADFGRLASYAASSYIWLGQPGRALPYAKEAIAFYQNVGLSDRSPTREAISRLDLALAHAELGQPDDAAEQVELALSSERITGSVLSRLGDLVVRIQHKYPELGMTIGLTDRYREMAASLNRRELPSP